MNKKVLDAIGKERLVAGKELLDDIIKILKKDINEIEISLYDKQKYETPNWSELQADKLGSLRTYKTVIKYLTIDGE